MVPRYMIIDIDGYLPQRRSGKILGETGFLPRELAVAYFDGTSSPVAIDVCSVYFYGPDYIPRDPSIRYAHALHGLPLHPDPRRGYILDRDAKVRVAQTSHHVSEALSVIRDLVEGLGVDVVMHKGGEEGRYVRCATAGCRVPEVLDLGWMGCPSADRLPREFESCPNHAGMISCDHCPRSEVMRFARWYLSAVMN